MQAPCIGVLISFCTTDLQFLDTAIREAQKLTAYVFVSVSDHFFDGKPENIDLLTQIFNHYPSVQFVYYEFDPTLNLPTQFWVTLGRKLAIENVPDDVTHLLLTDVDEILEVDRFKTWISSEKWRRFDCVRFDGYWYFRGTENQAITWSNTMVWVKRSVAEQINWLSFKDRQVIEDWSGPVIDREKGVDGTPLVHHFSWVRSKEEMLQKVSGWGHNTERNWIELVNKEFEGPFSGSDFVHGYTYKKVDPAFQFQIPSFSSSAQDQNNVRSFDRSYTRSYAGLYQDHPTFFQRVKNRIRKWVKRLQS